MEERTFHQRNQVVRVRALTDVVAVPVGRDAARVGTHEDVPEALRRVASEEDLQAYVNAGWAFRARLPDEPAAESPTAPVFLTRDGRLALGTRRLTVQFHEDLSDEEANAVLRPFGCRVERRLGFAPGLFEITITDPARDDVITVANQVTSSGLVRFAEPTLIEITGSR